MMLGYKKLGGVILGAAALFVLLPATADAQFVRYSPIFWSFEGRGGVAVPLGDLGDVVDAGPTVGAGLAYFLNPRFALRLDGNIDFFQAKDGEATSGGPEPDMTVWRYGGGFEVHLTDPSTSKGMVTLHAGLGGVTYNSQDFTVENFDAQTGQVSPGTTSREAALEDTYFAVNGGLRLGLNAGQAVTIFVGGGIHVGFLEEEDTAAIAALFGVPPFDSGVSVPLEGGIRVNVP